MWYINQKEISESKLLSILPDRIDGETVDEWLDRNRRGSCVKGDKVYNFFRQYSIDDRELY